MKIGEILKTERESRGLSLTDIEEKTKIRAKYLQALEEENYNEIPGEAYCMGFLRNYARFLDIDPNPLLYQYRTQVKNEESSSSPIIVEKDEKRSKKKIKPVSLSTGNRGSLIGLVVFALLIFSVAYIYFSGADRDTPPEPPPVSQEQQQDQEQEFNQEDVAPSTDNINIELIGKQLCWTRVTVDGEIQFEGNLDTGETKVFEAEDSIQVRLGNAGGVDVVYNGKKEPPLGESGQVVEKEYTKSN
jgi:cytoskeletal protein RodZ